MNITLCVFSGGMEGCLEKYHRATMEQGSMIQETVTLKKFWSVRSQQDPDGSDMFLDVSGVQLILI